MKRETIILTEEELAYFDFTSEYKDATWELRGETYDYVETIRTDKFSDGESWDTIVQRKSDSKFFKWNCWNAGDHNGYMMECGDNYMEQVFPKTITITTYE